MVSDDERPRRPSHLMDPDVLQARYEARVRAEHAAHAAGRPLSTAGETVYVTDRPQSRGGMHVSRVREFVMSALVGVTLFHFTLGMSVAAVLSNGHAARVWLASMAVVSGVGAVVAVRLIHHRSIVTPWLLLGASLGVGALVIVLR